MVSRRRLFISVVVSLGTFLALFLCEYKNDAIKANKKTYKQEKLSLFSKLSQNKKDIVLYGDSITDNAEWHELLIGCNLANRGIQGEKTAGLLSRLESGHVLGANTALVMIGINDILSEVDLERIQTNYINIIELLRGNYDRVVVQSTLHVADHMTDTNDKVDTLNHFLKLQKEKYANVEYLNVNERLSHGGQLRSNYTFDGVHLNGDAYVEWAKLLEPFCLR